MEDQSQDQEDSKEYEYDENVKIMIIGETKVGKTSLISKYCHNEFSDGQYLSTIGIDFQIKYLTIRSKKVRVQIWDTAGEERFRNISKNYFQSSDGFLVVYDITDKSSFDTMDYWIEEIKSNSQEHSKMILVGNKCDLEDERQIKNEDGKEYAKKKEIKFFEVSAKNGTNLNEVFETIVKDILKNYSPSENLKKRGSSILKYIVKPQKKGENK